jgi:hypothetical protein
MREIHPRWKSTRLGRWVARQGSKEVVRLLRERGSLVTRQAVHHWVTGRRLPRLEQVTAMQAISRGAIRLSDFTRCEPERDRA